MIVGGGKKKTIDTVTLCPCKKVTDASAVNRHFLLRRNNRLRPVCGNGKVSLYVMHERSMHGGINVSGAKQREGNTKGSQGGWRGYSGAFSSRKRNSERENEMQR